MTATSVAIERLARDFSAVGLAAKSKDKLEKTACEVTI
jgi:hypothetical protein